MENIEGSCERDFGDSGQASSSLLHGMQHCLLSPPVGAEVRSIRLRLKNEQGLHARPASHIVKIVLRSQARVMLTYKKKTVDARSLLGLLLLEAPQNSTIVVHAVGNDVDFVFEELKKAFNSSFEEAL